MAIRIGRRTLLAAPLALALPRPALGDSADEPAPLVILLEMDPWRAVIGSDTPGFALYEDGTVIYRTAAGYRTAKLDAGLRAALVAQLDIPALTCLAGFYNIDGHITDRPTQYLILFGEEGKRVTLSVYGSMHGGGRADMPQPFVRAYDLLDGYVHPRGREWMPDRIEVMIWPYEHARDESIVWPSRWPGLEDRSTRARNNGGYSIYVPASDLAELKRFLSTQRAKGAVLIGGRKWSVSLRFPFPGEALWMGQPLGKPGPCRAAYPE